MARTFSLSLVASAIGFAAALPIAFAQSAPVITPTRPAPAVKAEDAASPILAPAAGKKSPAPEAPKRTRAVSSGVAAALAAASPKYEPPPPKPEPKPESEPIDLREIDKPKNQIIRLSPMIVRERKPPIFTERAIHTEKGLTDIAMRRYISDADRALNRWTLPLFGSSMEARAMAMYAEDERLRNMSELEDAAKDASKTDSAAGTYIRREAQKTYLRSSDFGWSSGPPR